ncbi:hypothetical protein UFOVP230_36 [uncultured Caudovirales phage]|uniref:Uncharacterized protein n=1 Tax=uncultured Caudovirales phage TaxID=2100421 RepID=A0A6J7XSM1_9CAUD|nr:hypothetical protein UFOVP230_36 [uncultured Caudovirales phage]
MSRDGGKGDQQRPLGVPAKQFESNWDAIFKKPTPLADKIVKQVEEAIKNERTTSK